MRDINRLRDLPPGIFERVISGAMAETDALRMQVDALAEHVMTEPEPSQKHVSADDVACDSIGMNESDTRKMIDDAIKYGVGTMGVPYEMLRGTVGGVQDVTGEFTGLDEWPETDDELDDLTFSDLAARVMQRSNEGSADTLKVQELKAEQEEAHRLLGVRSQRIIELETENAELQRQVDVLERERFEKAELAGDRLTLLHAEQKKRAAAEEQAASMGRHNVELANSVRAWRQSNDMLREDHQKALTEARQEGASYVVQQAKEAYSLTDPGNSWALTGEQLDVLLGVVLVEYDQGEGSADGS